ncbi:MAG: hypothetical protein R6V13_07595, partial [Anaerolineae bacterium]
MREGEEESENKRRHTNKDNKFQKSGGSQKSDGPKQGGYYIVTAHDLPLGVSCVLQTKVQMSAISSGQGLLSLPSRINLPEHIQNGQPEQQQHRGHL